MDRRTWFASLFGSIATIFGYKTVQGDWREISMPEVISTRYSVAMNLKGSHLMSDFDILTKYMKYPESEAKEMLLRMKLQKLEELKLQIMAQNPQIMGIGLPKNA